MHDRLVPAAFPDEDWLAALDWCTELFGDAILGRAGYLTMRALANARRPDTARLADLIRRERSAVRRGLVP